MRQIILASSSPRRKQILSKVTDNFLVDSSKYEEVRGTITDPHSLVKIHAEGKARDVAKKYKDALIIGADSVVYINHEILEKPFSEQEAKEMLGKLSGKKHEVITGFCIIDTESGKSVTESIATNVYFKKLTEEEIDWYVSTGEPMDKAGAYALQEKGAVFIEKTEGDFYGAVGLPLFHLMKALKSFDVTL
ncbi:MAG: septum formation inhibitor Maf [Microgenomates group bacterium GW2011_GWC1_41_8]|nr:MAG: septum formation inhibitor Maf [Candidatus Levybacteria bacterium GW2011_GWA2_40_16]KKS24180.1 MAG: septum formation inhibitor Maf [Microgenomates group bacterium GW2011_GWC1_41_8]